jgi:5-methylcytosine-specific restriction endonuclease McrA
VFERDGWRCHLCHRKTPQRLRGTHKSAAPELDHIVPISKGGAHSYANTACSCRRCNGLKSNNVLGQPSLLVFMWGRPGGG